ncbi:hypothetical protein FD755_018638, partial [Muntiacus reevesi]
HTILNPMSGKETELILILDLRPDPVFQRRVHTPFRATLPALPGHIPFSLEAPAWGSTSGIKVRVPWTEEAAPLAAAAASAAPAANNSCSRRRPRRHRPLAKPRIARLSLGDLGSPGACLWHKPRGGSPVVFCDLSRRQSPLSVVWSFWRLQVGSGAQPQLGSRSGGGGSTGEALWPAW